MNKSELIDAISVNAELSKADAKKALEGFIKATSETLQKGDKIALVGFGSFSVTERSARKGKNPRTGEVIDIAAKKSVKFKAGSELSGALND